uniref:Uncharacterized protein n=1 Tax=Euplotes harpa TaxID=151035 RepID=A0A7S3NC32_9SPIT|mmetsp:Transcript_29825/g.34175  ORF Transcript_29825/g.34175 Transcript_29825/m.34175 type:complete len:134 (+) Transcript_29825:408-809(+)
MLAISDDQNEIQESADVNILAVNAAQQAAKFAKRGQFREAQAYACNQKKLIKKHMKTEQDKTSYTNWKHAMNDMYDQLHEQNNLEEQIVYERVKKPVKVTEQKRKRKAFNSKISDAMSNNMHHALQFNSMNLM